MRIGYVDIVWLGMQTTSDAAVLPLQIQLAIWCKKFGRHVLQVSAAQVIWLDQVALNNDLRMNVVHSYDGTTVTLQCTAQQDDRPTPAASAGTWVCNTSGRVRLSHTHPNTNSAA
jgi:hypothetical protein